MAGGFPAPRALPAARRYGAIAPAMPHALHMPSHTYIAVGMWQESIDSNLLAGAAARKLGWVQEEMHSMDYLVYAYLQGAQGGAAQAVVDQLSGVTVDDAARTTQEPSRCSVFFSGEKCWIELTSRSPTTMSARPSRIWATLMRRTEKASFHKLMSSGWPAATACGGRQGLPMSSRCGVRGPMMFGQEGTR